VTILLIILDKTCRNKRNSNNINTEQIRSTVEVELFGRLEFKLMAD